MFKRQNGNAVWLRRKEHKIMSKVMEYLNSSATVKKRELVLGTIAGLMTGVVIGTYAARPKHPRRPQGAPECPPPPMPPHRPDERPPMPPRESRDPGRRPPRDCKRDGR